MAAEALCAEALRVGASGASGASGSERASGSASGSTAAAGPGLVAGPAAEPEPEPGPGPGLAGAESAASAAGASAAGGCAAAEPEPEPDAAAAGSAAGSAAAAADACSEGHRNTPSRQSCGERRRECTAASSPLPQNRPWAQMWGMTEAMSRGSKDGEWFARESCPGQREWAWEGGSTAAWGATRDAPWGAESAGAD